VSAAAQGSTRPRVLVVTVVHRPDDGRILHRGIRSLRAAGMHVTYAAPWRATSVAPPEGLATRDLPRAAGRRRLDALLAAVRLLREEGPQHDLVLLHDPELLLAVRIVGVRRLPPVVWDVHEDVGAALMGREWIPRPLRRAVVAVVARFERWAERELHLVLAEAQYRTRFLRAHPVVRNLPWGPSGAHRDADVPAATRDGDDGRACVLYIGRISAGRGLDAMLELGRRLGDAARVELVGDPDAELRTRVEAADADAIVRWHGYVPSDRTGPFLARARVGLCLLDDEPNYRVSLPSKVVEYLAHGIPVVATPLPEVAALLADGGGTLVPFGDVDAAEAAVRRYVVDRDAHATDAARARELAAPLTWEAEGERLVSFLTGWTRGA
jgi:glycosyltransferase involved in cell wall biosynthesis